MAVATVQFVNNGNPPNSLQGTFGLTYMDECRCHYGQYYGQ